MGNTQQRLERLAQDLDDTDARTRLNREKKRRGGFPYRELFRKFAMAANFFMCYGDFSQTELRIASETIHRNGYRRQTPQMWRANNIEFAHHVHGRHRR